MRKVWVAVCLLAAAGCGRGDRAAGPTAPARESPDAVEEELKRFAGEWRMLRLNREDVLEPRRVTFRGAEMAVEGQPPVRFEIEPSQSPKWFDLAPEGDPLLGIYRFEGDRLTIYVVSEGPGGGPPQRPRGFDEDHPGQLFELVRAR